MPERQPICYRLWDVVVSRGNQPDAKEREREAKSSGPHTNPRHSSALEARATCYRQNTALWNRVEHTAREVFGNYGFGEIRPPIFEATELFARGSVAKPILFPRKCTPLKTMSCRTLLNFVPPL